jgi:AraC family transcriptional regulator, regulatory protein of adaptative response / methylphosphotriester-DNA alkyltransferase methyltransferase
MPDKANTNITRAEEITRNYFDFLNKHIEDVISGRETDFMMLADIASELCISHKHLTDTVQKETGNHPCFFYDQKIIIQAQGLLKNSDLSVAEIAKMFTYDPSNFAKFFKKMTGETPKNWRQTNK